MFPFSIKDRPIVLHPFSTHNNASHLGTLLFFLLSLLVGCSISSSITYTILIIAALFAIIVIFRPEIGLYLMVLMIPLEPLTDIIESLTAIKLIGWVVLAGWMLNIALTKKSIIFPRQGWYIVAFFTWGLLSAFWAINPIRVVQSLSTTIQLFGFYVIVVNLVDSKNRVYHLLVALVIGCIIATGITLFYFREAYIIEGLQEERIGLGSLNHFPTTLLLAMPFLFLSFIFVKSNLLRFGSLVVTCMILTAFFATMSRGAVLGLMMVMIAMLIKYRRHVPSLMVFISPVILTALYFMPEYFWQRMVSGFTLEDRGTGRLAIWMDGLHIIADNPLLGVGVFNFSTAHKFYLINFYKPRAAHNIYISAVAELGIIGGVLLLLLIISHLRVSYKASDFFKEKGDQSGEILAMSALLSFLGLLAVGISLDFLNWKYFWFSIALIGVISQITLNTYFEKE